MKKTTKDKLKYISTILVMLIAIYGMNVVTTITHENIHQIIFNRFGYNSTIELSFLGIMGETTPEDKPNYKITKEGRIKMDEMHIWNEIVGYYFVILINLLYLKICIDFILKIKNGN